MEDMANSKASTDDTTTRDYGGEKGSSWTKSHGEDDISVDRNLVPSR